MNRADLEKRAAEAQVKCRGSHLKMQARIESGNRAKWLAGIKKYYDVAEPEPWASLPQERRANIENMDDSTLKAFCKGLCSEAINRDFCSLVSTGDTGKVGLEVYRALL